MLIYFIYILIYFIYNNHTLHIVYKHRTTLIGYVVIYFAIYLINCNVVENIPLGKNIIMVDLHK